MMTWWSDILRWAVAFSRRGSARCNADGASRSIGDHPGPAAASERLPSLVLQAAFSAFYRKIAPSLSTFNGSQFALRGMGFVPSVMHIP